MFTGFLSVLGMVFLAGKWYNIGKKNGEGGASPFRLKKVGCFF